MHAVLADNLSYFLSASSMTTADLAQRARLAEADLQQFLAGDAWPCPRTQGRLAIALGVTTADLHRERDDLP